MAISELARFDRDLVLVTLLIEESSLGVASALLVALETISPWATMGVGLFILYGPVDPIIIGVDKVLNAVKANTYAGT